MAEIEDQELIEGFQNPERQNYIFNLLVRKYQQKLYWQIRKLVLDHEDANDILQNVFIKVWKNLHTFRSDSKLYTWLYRIAINEALNFIKQKKKASLTTLEESMAELASQVNLEPGLSADRIQLKLQQAVLTLPEQQRLVFNLKYYDDLKYEDIAEILQLSVGGLKATYHHAVKKIEKYLTDN